MTFQYFKPKLKPKLFLLNLAPGPPIRLEDNRGNAVAAGTGRQWSSIPQFRIAPDEEGNEQIKMVCDEPNDVSTCRVEVTIVKN